MNRKIAATFTKRIIRKGLARWLPIIGAAGVRACADYDMVMVASTAIALFEQGVEDWSTSLHEPEEATIK